MSEGFSYRQRDYHDALAHDYDARGSHFLPRVNRNHYKKIKHIAVALRLSEHQEKDDLVLEVGVGTGLHAHWMIYNRPLRLVGGDISTQMLAVAKRRLYAEIGSKFFPLCFNGQFLPFPDNAFDAVYCSATLHHMECPLQTILEMVRVVKPGKRVAIMEPNWIFPLNLAQGLFNKLERNVLQMRYHNLKRWGCQAGLRDLQVQHFIYTPPFPKALLSWYDRVDDLAARIPVIRRFSVMVFLSGTKPLDDNYSGWAGVR
ncbi:MAG: class I SAM-dependent methyltransferase [Candidatus Methanomethyliaceae archaeon]